ncbi:MAG: hypothetical protein CME62_02485 [Halobacteriovoraceae bacterium]|nr:hypothetical protein [Halobacteriovoraceae bacterium]|tara:strand:- start:18743 stop:19390 length:648 start_codon:yes stop_codon:yes gene_type:complete
MDKEKLFQNLLNKNVDDINTDQLADMFSEENAEEENFESLRQTKNDDENTEKHIQVEVKSEQYKKGFDYAIRILSLRDYSEYKMREKLRTRQIPNGDIDKIVEKLIKLNYLREEEYTRQRIKQLLVKGYANSYILQKLAREQLQCSTAVIDEIRHENELTSTDRIHYLIEKKLRYKEIPKEWEPKMKLKQKVTAFLVSKGYNFSEINTALSEYFR